jgi:hypothetical protein
VRGEVVAQSVRSCITVDPALGLVVQASLAAWLITAATTAGRETKRGVAGASLGDGRLGPLGHGALGGRRDHAVLRGDQVPGRLAAPGRLGDRPAQRVDTPGDLGVGHERCQFLRHIGGRAQVWGLQPAG